MRRTVGSGILLCALLTGGDHPPSKANTRNKNWDEYQDPESSVDFFVKFLQLGLQHLQPHSAVYQWHATKRQALVEQASVGHSCKGIQLPE